MTFTRTSDGPRADFQALPSHRPGSSPSLILVCCLTLGTPLSSLSLTFPMAVGAGGEGGVDRAPAQGQDQ